MHAIDPGPLNVAALASPDLLREPRMLLLLQLFVQPFAPFEWGADRLLGLAAVSTADVFSGMDTWTEQDFEGEELARVQAVSLKLFGALNRYVETLVSSQA